MENDPDIIRWSTLKGFGKHFAFWFVIYGIAVGYRYQSICR